MLIYELVTCISINKLKLSFHPCIQTHHNNLMAASPATVVVYEKKTWERRMDEAKKKHRPKLKDWTRDGFATRRNDVFQQLQQISALQTSEDLTLDTFSCNSLDKDRFVGKYEGKCKPCVITDIPTVEKWRAASADNWSLAKLNSRFKDRYFKVGEDDDGYKVKERLKYFIKYMEHNQDDSPLYIFDGSFDNDDQSKSLLTDYKVPSYFTDDLFKYVGEERRPPYRWILLGPTRSGSSVHVDPLATSAWNTVLVGRKRWVLFPPETPKSIAKGLDVIKKGERGCSFCV